ncbi:MAG: hypothetical protein ACRD40_07330 [Candidatus Acidiferrales bacterium]
MRIAPILVAVMFACLCPKNAVAQAASLVTGVYEGSYQCTAGAVKLKLAIVASGDGSARGRLTFAQPDNMGAATGSFNLKGNYDPATGKFKLQPLNWNPPVPPGAEMLGVDGAFDARRKEVSGSMTGGCSTFRATRNEEESEALPKQPPAPPKVGGGTQGSSDAPQN